MTRRTTILHSSKPLLTRSLSYREGAKGRPPFDPVALFKVVAIQAQRTLSDARMEFIIHTPLPRHAAPRLPR